MVSGLPCRKRRVLANLFGLPQVAAVVHGDKSQPRAQGHLHEGPQQSRQGQHRPDAGEIEAVGALRQAADLGRDAAVFGQRRIHVRLGRRRVDFRGFELALDRQILAGNPLADQQAVGEGAPAGEVALAPHADSGFQGCEGAAIPHVQVPEALRGGPAAGLGAPVELRVRKTVGDGIGVTQVRVDFGDQHGKIGTNGHGVEYTRPR